MMPKEYTAQPGHVSAISKMVHLWSTSESRESDDLWSTSESRGSDDLWSTSESRGSDDLWYTSENRGPDAHLSSMSSERWEYHAELMHMWQIIPCAKCADTLAAPHSCARLSRGGRASAPHCSTTRRAHHSVTQSGVPAHRRSCSRSCGRLAPRAPASAGWWRRWMPPPRSPCARPPPPACARASPKAAFPCLGHIKSCTVCCSTPGFTMACRSAFAKQLQWAVLHKCETLSRRACLLHADRTGTSISNALRARGASS